VQPGKTGAFEILSIDLEKKRIGVALVPEGTTRGEGPVLDAKESDEVRAFTERKDEPQAEGFGSLADKLRGALKPQREK
jgi:hypothetical protein